MPSFKKEPLELKRDLTIKVGRKHLMLYVHPPCGTQFYRQPSKLAKGEACGICLKTDALELVT